jgi:uncharacterized protein YybS (DUF2232 family)
LDKEHDVEENIQGAAPIKPSLQIQTITIASAIVVMTGGFLVLQHSQLTGFLQFLLPAPIVLISLRYSLWSGVGTVIVSTLSVSLLSGFLNSSFLSGYHVAISFLLSIGGIAIVLAVCFRQKAYPTTTISCVALYYIALEIGFLYMQQDMTLEMHIQQRMTLFKEMFVRIYETKEVGWQDFESQLEAIAHVLSITFPLISGLSISIITYVITRSILKMRSIATARLGRFQDWQISEHLVWGLILGGMLYHLKSTRPVGINILLGLAFLYYLAGCSIIVYFLKQKEASRFFQFIAYALLFFQMPHIFTGLGLLLTGYSEQGVYLSLPAILLVAGIGLSNVWIDFRRRAAQTKE